jgi:hypothetical protein
MKLKNAAIRKVDGVQMQSHLRILSILRVVAIDQAVPRGRIGVI